MTGYDTSTTITTTTTTSSNFTIDNNTRYSELYSSDPDSL